jgi:hypothetical protein
MSQQCIVNQLVRIPFLSTGLVTGLTTFSFAYLLNGVSTVVTPTFTEIGGGLYTFNFTPTSTGRGSLFIQGSIQASFDVVNKDILTYLKNLEDESLGSWQWNKTSGVLTLLRQDSSVLATFNVVDTLTEAHRERVG